jgi:hypothetical protein
MAAINLIIDKTIMELCSKGDLEKTRQYYQENSQSISNLRIECCFNIACKRGLLEMAQWFYSIHPDLDVNNWGNAVHYRYHAFHSACETNNMEIAKWLISLTKSNTIANYNEYCTIACASGHLELIKDIASRVPNFNVSYKNHELFHCAMNNRYINSNMSVKYGYIVEWLQTMKPWVYKIQSFREELSHYDDDYDDWIGTHYPEMDTNEERNWNMRKYVVYASSDAAPNKKTLIYKLPIDVSRMVICFV